MTKLNESFEMSREASEYEARLHLLQRLRDGGQRTVIEMEMIAEAIEDGEVVEIDDNEAIINHQWLMTEFNVVVDIKAKEIETAYEVES